jgi:glycerol-3-phosphate dehydrogenase subunit B
MKTHDLSCDLFVIGQGLSGMSAALFAVNRGLKVCQAGAASPLVFHSGLFDFLSSVPGQGNKNLANPWKELDELKGLHPHHPYAKISKREIRSAFDEVATFLSSEGLYYGLDSGLNAELITSIGTVKTSYMIPLSMRSGVPVFKRKVPALIVDIKGLREFSAEQIRETLKGVWPSLSAATVDLSFAQKGEKTAEHLARALDLESNRDILVNAIRPHLKREKAVGLPPVLGIRNSAEAVADLEHRLGRAVFEIPCLPPAPPGVRLKEAFEHGLGEKGVIRFGSTRINSVSQNGDGTFTIVISTEFMEKTVRAKGLVLASGRFVGKGLVADRKSIREPLFGLPVVQPDTRDGWFRKLFFDERGHAVNRAGIETDPYQRPLDENGNPFHNRLFAAGTILAHQDWTREKSGSGIAMATAFKAVASYIQLAKGKNKVEEQTLECTA